MTWIDKQYSRLHRWRKPLCATLLLTLVIAVGSSLAGVHYRIMGHYEGIFAIRQGKGILLSDDIMLGEVPKLVLNIPLEPLKELFERKRHPAGLPYLDYEFFRRDGSGFVRNVFPDGRELRICFSRFIDDDGGVVKGLVVGGGLPFMEGKRLGNNHDDTGMAYYDGARWYHLWCNANEIMVLGDRQEYKACTHDWEFLGSRVVEASDSRILLQSSHRVRHESTVLRVERYALFQAGKPYFLLLQRVRNGGDQPVRYSWVYADEPWVGNYGSSSGNVGWSASGFHYYEGRVDPAKSDFAGIADMGNPRAGEVPGSYSGYANFIQWLGERPPTFVYFANQIGRFAEAGQQIPLASQLSRCIGLEWWPELLPPGREHVYLLAIGMGDRGADGKPVKQVIEGAEEFREKVMTLR